MSFIRNKVFLTVLSIILISGIIVSSILISVLLPYWGDILEPEEYKNHDPILILNDQNFTDYGFPGTISYINSYNNTVKFNLFQNNTFFGVQNSRYSTYSKIYMNSFYFNNLLGTSQAYDEGYYSHWYYFGTLGNYWNEWTNGSYVIDGPSNSTDLYPLLLSPV